MHRDYQSILVFDLNGIRFGLDANKVRESVWLPELTPLEEAPPWVVGMFNLRGHIIPVTDLNLRFGHPALPLSLSDQVIVLDNEDESMGLIVSEVLEVLELLPCAIKPAPHFETRRHGLDQLATGIASVADTLITLIDVSKLTLRAETSPINWLADHTAYDKRAYTNIDADIHSQLRVRAKALRQSSAQEDVPFIGLAVVEISGEYFGIELTAVQEFRDIKQLRPIPCCPPHILGAMNLRGKLLTLIDPRRALNLAPSSTVHKAVIALAPPAFGAERGDQLIGLAVDEVHDVVYLRDKELHAPPTTLRERCEADITGTTPYNGKTMTILNLTAFLARDEWLVNETV